MDFGSLFREKKTSILLIELCGRSWPGDLHWHLHLSACTVYTPRASYCFILDIYYISPQIRCFGLRDYNWTHLFYQSTDKWHGDNLRTGWSASCGARHLEPLSPLCSLLCWPLLAPWPGPGPGPTTVVTIVKITSSSSPIWSVPDTKYSSDTDTALNLTPKILISPLDEG